MTQKRIKAYKTDMLYSGHASPTPVYIINASDIRALAEQFCRDSDAEIMRPNRKLKTRQDTVLHCFKRAGMTPGRKERAK